VPEQVGVDALGDPGGTGHAADDLADALAGQHMRRRAGSLLAAGEQRPCSPRADMQLEQLGQVAPDRHLAALVALAVLDGDHALSQADVLDPELHQLGRAGAGLQQGLQHQPGPVVLGVGLVEKAQSSSTVSRSTPPRRSGAARRPARALAALKTALLWA